MSVSHTEQAVRDRRKTVTRRRGWRLLQPGDRLTLCRKVMGRKPGEPLERIAEVEVVSVRREPLMAITAADVFAEAVPVEAIDEWTPAAGPPPPDVWARWYAWTFGLRVTDEVTRIEWRYLA